MLPTVILIATFLLNNTVSLNDTDIRGPIFDILPEADEELEVTDNAIRLVVFVALALTVALILIALIGHHYMFRGYIDLDIRLGRRKSEDRRALFAFP